MDCFWPTGCANSQRCKEAGLCIARWQNANKDKLFGKENPMPNHLPKTYSHEDVLFLLETFGHCRDALGWAAFVIDGKDQGKNIHADVDRCIKILEKEDEV